MFFSRFEMIKNAEIVFSGYCLVEEKGSRDKVALGQVDDHCQPMWQE